MLGCRVVSSNGILATVLTSFVAGFGDAVGVCLPRSMVVWKTTLRGVGRGEGHIVCRDDVAILLPYSLLSTSKLQS